MLVPLVLRSIVLPYLRSTASAGGSSGAAAAIASVGTVTRRRELSSSMARTRAVEHALFTEQDEDYRHPWHVAGGYPPPPPPPRRFPSRPLEDADRLQGARPESIEKRKRKPPKGRAKPPSESPAPRRDVFDTTSSAPRINVPPSIQKLLHAKLYRMCVFHILATPEYLADVKLVEYVIGRLEKNGAGKLAARLKRTLEVPVYDANGRVRLQPPPERTNWERRPPMYWRQPLVTREPTEYVGTPSQRRTHFFNHRLSTYLTKQHEAPKWSTVARHGVLPSRLKTVKDLLQYINHLRAHNNFVPDRVTANIVLKAWVISLNRRHEWVDLPPEDRKCHLREMFRLFAHSMENGTQPEILAPLPGSDPHLAFDPTLNYDQHVRPFVLTVTRALTRVHDHEGRSAVYKWGELMEAKLKRDKTRAAMQQLQNGGEADQGRADADDSGTTSLPPAVSGQGCDQTEGREAVEQGRVAERRRWSRNNTERLNSTNNQQSPSQVCQS